MRKKLILAILVLVLASGCLTSEEKRRVETASVIAATVAHNYDVEDPADPIEVKKFLEANARAWVAFNEAVNERKPWWRVW